MTSRFIFDSYKLEKTGFRFIYVIEHKGEVYTFQETLQFPTKLPKIPEAVLVPYLQSLFLALGISYWKTFCPEEIIIKPFSLTYEQATFWNTFYTKGLGEFFFRNNIDFRGLINFPYMQGMQKKPLTPYPRKDRSLLPIGGGKDGIVVAELLREAKKDFTPFLIYTGIKNTEAQENVTAVMGRKPLQVKRTIDPKLLVLNKEKGVFNGHVPMVGMHSFISLLAACLYDFTSVVLGNEESANHGNVMYFGEIVNHQWSKSLEFEELLQDYMGKYVTEDILYFSLIRGFTEIKIAQLFSHYPNYFSSFVSCNRGYAMHLEGQTHWCGNCPKCAFVFTILAAYLSKETVVNIFRKNLFADEKLLPLFKELLGIEAFKPFECVGTPREMHLAFLLAYEQGTWEGDSIMNFFKEEVLPTLSEKNILEEKVYKLHSTRVPETFQEVLKGVV